MSNNVSDGTVLQLTARIVASHVTRNAITSEALPALVLSVRNTLATLETPVPEAVPAQEPAVPARRSIQKDHLICLEDGAKVKMLKRYLATRYQLTPDQYRAKWGLPPDYPMVAPDYAKARSALAKQIGLGRKAVSALPPPAAQANAPSPAPAAPGNGASAPAAHTADSVFANFPAGAKKPKQAATPKNESKSGGFRAKPRAGRSGAEVVVVHKKPKKRTPTPRA